MRPDNESNRELQIYRTREWLLGALLGFSAMGSSILYFVLLRTKLALPFLIALIVVEWLVLLGVYLIIVSKMRRRRR